MNSPLFSRIMGVIFLLVGVCGLIYSISQGRVAYGIVGFLIFVYLGYKYLKQAKERAAGVEPKEAAIRRRRDLPAAIDPNEIITSPTLFSKKKAEEPEANTASDENTAGNNAPASDIAENAASSEPKEADHE